MPFYAVKRGRVPGIYSKWSECEDQVKNFSKPIFKKFSTKSEALHFINEAITPKSLLKNKKMLVSSNPTANYRRRKHIENQTDIKNHIAKENETPEICVYTDGCCRGNGKSNPIAGIGVYWGSHDHPDNISEPLSGRQTNNRAEIFAVIRALEQAKNKNIKEICVYTDSAFLINCITKWIKKWKKNNWKLANGGDVINKDELQLLEKTQENINVKYVHVQAHCGIKGNEEADRLANEGALKQLSLHSQ